MWENIKEIFINLVTLEVNNFAGLLLYTIPVIICLIGVIVRSTKRYQYDLASRNRLEERKQKALEEGIAIEDVNVNYQSDYCPSITIGNVLGGLVLAFIPIINLWLAIFDFIPSITGGIFNKISKLLDIPLVPK